jgi:phosphopantetheinyl transferase
MDTTLSHEQIPGTSILASERNSFPELNSPVLILLKTDAVRPDELIRLESFLSEEEIAKSRRFRFSRHRVSYIVVHGFLRWMLGRHLGISPETVEITYNSYGKPSVAGYSKHIFFNLSHSSGISVLAFDPDNEIGVDVERTDEEFEYESIVQHFFSKEEEKHIQQIKTEARKRFYEIWTRKEAYLKAAGTGITENLHVDVLKEKMTGNINGKDGSGCKDFLFSSIMFENEFRITLAVGEGSGSIRAFVIGNNENGTPINES